MVVFIVKKGIGVDSRGGKNIVELLTFTMRNFVFIARAASKKQTARDPYLSEMKEKLVIEYAEKELIIGNKDQRGCPKF